MSRLTTIGSIVTPVLALFITGCIHPISITPLRVNLPTPQRHPISVAYVIPDALLNEETVSSGGGGDRVIYQPYRAVDYALGNALDQMFRSAVRVGDFGDVSRNAGVSLIFVPTITHTGSASTSWMYWPPRKFWVSLDCDIYGAKRNRLQRVSGVGSGTATVKEFQSDFGIAGKRAMENAIIQVVSSIDARVIENVALDMRKEDRVSPPSSMPAETGESERLAELRVLREGDFMAVEEDFRTDKSIREAGLGLQANAPAEQLAALSPTVHDASGGVPNNSASVANTNIVPESRSRFRVSAHIEDDPTKGDEILGNGDGLIQKGEAFDLVVVVANTSTSTANDVTCVVTLPEDESLKAYGELHFSIVELAPAAATTNRINLAMPLGATTSTAPVCRIGVKEAEPSGVEHLNYELPMELKEPQEIWR